jgi:hypothetical protein
MQITTFAAATLFVALVSCAAPPSEKQDVAAQMRDPKVIAFYAATPHEKAELMRSHFTRYAARPGLTEAQRAACLGMLATVSEAAYGPRDTPEWEAWAMQNGGEDEAVKAAFGDDLESIEAVLHSIE